MAKSSVQGGLRVSWTTIAMLLPVIVLAHLVTTLLGQRAQTHATSNNVSEPIRVVLMSDTHVIGPQYVPGTESNPVDNESILKTPKRLEQVAKHVNSISPQPDLAVFVGDVVHNALDASTDYNWFIKHRNALTVASELFKLFKLPVYFMWGNHDYKTECRNTDVSVPRDVNHKLLSTFFSSPPYQVVDVGPWRLILLNSMLGYTWDPLHPGCEPRLASYGAEQLQWLDKQLAAGKPSIVFMHFPIPIRFLVPNHVDVLVAENDVGVLLAQTFANVRNEAEATDYPDLLSVLKSHNNVRQVYSGHYHRGLVWGDKLYGFPFTTLPAVRYDSDNFFILQLERDGSSHKVLDWDKNRGGARCSDTWSYKGDMKPTGEKENGDCGEPTVHSSEAYKLPKIGSISDVPSHFNPEPSCHFPFAEVALHSCATDGPTQACCGIVKEALKPSSAAFFASCLCQPDFWQAVNAMFAEQGGKHALANVMDHCIAEAGALVQYLGQPHSACPFPKGGAGAEAS